MKLMKIIRADNKSFTLTTENELEFNKWIGSEREYDVSCFYNQFSQRIPRKLKKKLKQNTNEKDIMLVRIT